MHVDYGGVLAMWDGSDSGEVIISKVCSVTDDISIKIAVEAQATSIKKSDDVNGMREKTEVVGEGEHFKDVLRTV